MASSKRRRLLSGPWGRLCLWTLALLLLLGAPAAAQDGAPNRAGLVVVHGDGRAVTRCVEFEDETISGMDLLTQSGLDLSVDAANAMGGAVCRIDDEGCSFPQQSCFCRCQRSPCMYWSFWQRTDDGWAYSQLGAAHAEVNPGDVNAWVWNEGVVGQSAEEEPPEMDLAAICAAETSTAAPATVQLSLTPTPIPTGEGAVPTSTADVELAPEQSQEREPQKTGPSITEAASTAAAVGESRQTIPTTVVVGGLITVGLPLMVLFWLFARRRA